MPTCRPACRRMWPIMRTVVVLPLVPVTLTIGILRGAPGGSTRAMTAPATSRGAPLGRRQVHAQSWRRVDLDHGAGTHRCRDVAEPDVDAAHVETDRGRGAPAHLGDLGMHLAGHVAARAPGREVGVAPKPDDLAGARHRARRVAPLGEGADRHVVDREPGERPAVALPAPRAGGEAD